MPPYQKAKSRAQRVVAAIAEHSPNKLNSANKGMASMDKEDLHAMAATSEKGLPEHVKSKGYGGLAGKRKK